MSQIKVSDLTFAYDGSYDNVFEDVSFIIDTDWRLGLIGRNGRGKTTLLNLFMGKYDYSGSIICNTDFEYFPFYVNDESQNTIDVIEQICPNYVYWKVLRELSLLGVCDDVMFRPFETLSKGEQTKVMLAVLFSAESRFLLIDEPTNHLDQAAREAVAKYLKRKKGFIIVSHDRSVLDICTDHTMAINRSNIEIVKGSFSSWFTDKERHDKFQLAQNIKLKKEISRLRETAAEKAKWSNMTEKSKYQASASGLKVDRGYVGHKSAKMMSGAKACEARAEKAAAEKSELLKDTESTEDLKISPLRYHSDTLAYLKNISIVYGDTTVCSGIEFDIKRGDRIMLSGRNGSGKSAVIKLICGSEIKFSGECKVGSGLKISYVPQGTSHLCGSLRDFAAVRCIDESLFKSILRKLDFSREQFDKDISILSEGQKKKVLIAGSLCENAHLYIWDEPLNYIDVYSRMQLEDLIVKYEPTMVFVEHDKTFGEKTATRTVCI